MRVAITAGRGPSRPWPGPRPRRSLAMVTSPGKVVSSAPWAQPRRSASSGDRPGEQAVDQAGGEAVAAADAVDDVELAASG